MSERASVKKEEGWVIPGWRSIEEESKTALTQRGRRLVWAVAILASEQLLVRSSNSCTVRIAIRRHTALGRRNRKRTAAFADKLHERRHRALLERHWTVNEITMCLSERRHRYGAAKGALLREKRAASSCRRGHFTVLSRQHSRAALNKQVESWRSASHRGPHRSPITL